MQSFDNRSVTACVKRFIGFIIKIHIQIASIFVNYCKDSDCFMVNFKHNGEISLLSFLIFF